jgi:hypothetical protein
MSEQMVGHQNIKRSHVSRAFAKLLATSSHLLLGIVMKKQELKISLSKVCGHVATGMLATSSLDHTVNHAHVHHTCQSASPVTYRADGYSHRRKSDLMVPITSSSICSIDPRSLLLFDLLQLGPFDWPCSTTTATLNKNKNIHQYKLNKLTTNLPPAFHHDILQLTWRKLP